MKNHWHWMFIGFTAIWVGWMIYGCSTIKTRNNPGPGPIDAKYTNGFVPESKGVIVDDPPPMPPRITDGHALRLVITTNTLPGHFEIKLLFPTLTNTYILESRIDSKPWFTNAIFPPFTSNQNFLKAGTNRGSIDFMVGRMTNHIQEFRMKIQ